MDLQHCRPRQMTGRKEVEYTCKFVRAGGRGAVVGVALGILLRYETCEGFRNERIV